MKIKKNLYWRKVLKEIIHPALSPKLLDFISFWIQKKHNGEGAYSHYTVHLITWTGHFFVLLFVFNL